MGPRCLGLGAQGKVLRLRVTRKKWAQVLRVRVRVGVKVLRVRCLG